MATVRWLCRAVGTGLLLLPLAGCSDLLVRRIDSPWLHVELLPGSEPSGDFSPETVELIKQHKLVEVYRRSPADVLKQLQTLASDDPSKEMLLALAEISRVLARRAEKDRSGDAPMYHYLSAGYAYHYLAEKSRPQCRDELERHDEPTGRARELYNGGLAGWLRGAGVAGSSDPRTPGPVLELPMVRHGFAWRPEEFGPLLFCADHAQALRPADSRGWAYH